MTEANTKGREANAAQPLGERKGTASKSATRATGRAERKSAGPDGPDAAAVSRTLKR
ncbi:hypothetical protein [Phenylobacterium sp.]|uniref:hypothetical protein n=1 Tax=Phenylobacterium sp. TaxID=1871053 RepID=UPI0025DD6481|nr:hypothetical protein [Phenylobacterium sp.]